MEGFPVCYVLCYDWRNAWSGGELEVTLWKTINHDFAEVFIGDIKTPVKHASPKLKEMLTVVEEKMMENFIAEEIPPEFQEVFLTGWKEGKDTTLEGRLLEFADKLDQFYEAFAELKRGNTDKEFVIMYQQALAKLLDLPLPNSVKYFRHEILKDAVAEDTQIDIVTLTEEILKTNNCS